MTRIVHFFALAIFEHKWKKILAHRRLARMVVVPRSWVPVQSHGWGSS